MGSLRLAVRFPLILLCIFVTLALMVAGGMFGAKRFNRKVMCASFAVGAVLIGLRIHTQGKLADARPLLLVSNHFSYIDLFAIGSTIPAAFTPKSEIAGWPIIGTLSKMAGCVFIDRRPSKTMEAKTVLEQSRATGEIICLFPEGTTNEGRKLLPFKSSFFSIAEKAEVAVQPLSIVYTQLNNKPLDTAGLPIVGWYGDALLFPHLVQFLRQKNADVTLVFHAPVMGSAFPSRKELAAYCQQQVERAYQTLLPQLFAA